MEAAAELRRNPLSKRPIQPEYREEEQADTGRDCRTASRETKVSGVNADWEILFFSFQLTTCRIGNLTRLIHTLAICHVMCDHTYIAQHILSSTNGRLIIMNRPVSGYFVGQVMMQK